MIQILYQNNITGTAHDITTLTTSAKWQTKITGFPAGVELTVLNNTGVDWTPGGVITIKDGSRGLFYGYVFKIARSEKTTTQITAHDQLRYMKNKETYVFSGRRADQIIRQIAEDFKLKTGAIANTGYVIPSMIEDAQTLFDICLKALDHTLINTGKMFYMWDDFGSLRVTDVTDSRVDSIIGDNSLATGYSYTVSIDSDTYTRIKLVRDNAETGKRDVYLFQDSTNMKLWGILQDYQKVDENMNAAQIKDLGDKMIEFYNRPKRTFDVNGISDLSIRAGCAVPIYIDGLKIKQYFVVDDASHDLIKQTMKLKLKVV